MPNPLSSFTALSDKVHQQTYVKFKQLMDGGSWHFVNELMIESWDIMGAATCLNDTKTCNLYSMIQGHVQTVLEQAMKNRWWL